MLLKKLKKRDKNGDCFNNKLNKIHKTNFTIK